MKKRAPLIVLLCLALAPLVMLRGFQRNFQRNQLSGGSRHNQQYEWEMQDPVDDPPDANELGEFTFARLRYRSFGFGGGGGGGGFGRRGFGGGRSSWGIDSNRADRLFAVAARRLTRVHTRSVEDILDIDDGPLDDYPWLYAVEVGRWGMSPQQGKRLREYLDRGGFLMVDDFHGPQEWEIFMEGLRQVFPDRPVVDIPSDDPIFHMLSDVDTRVQVPGAHYTYDHVTYEHGGYEPKWRGIYDERGRIMVAICHNMDLGDAWQYADDPHYPEQFASVALRIAVNYLTYSMTH